MRRETTGFRQNDGGEPRGGRPFSGRRRRGAVLLLILVIIVVLSAMIVQFTEKGMAEIAAEGHYVERERLRLTAYSALETTLAVLADVIAVDGGLTAPQQGWDDPLGVAGFETEEGQTVHVSFVDETGRLPLNGLGEETLVVLFTDMGFEIEQAFKLTQSLLDWIDEDDAQRIDGAEDETYAIAEWPYTPSNQPVQRLSELAVVEGFREFFFDEYGRPNDYFRSFADTVSIYSSEGAVNANSVSDLALRAYAGLSDAQLRALAEYRAGADRVPGTADDRYFASSTEVTQVLGELPRGVTIGVGVSVLRINIAVVEAGGGSFVLEAVVQPGRGGTKAAAGASGGRSTGGRAAGVGGTPAAGGASTVNYPFVFLELREDVGQNQSVAAPGGETETTVGGPSDSAP
jgi:type II secretory pathway component PulK